MGGVFMEGGGNSELICFTDRIGNPPRDAVEAVVIWRGANGGGLQMRTLGPLEAVLLLLNSLTYHRPFMWLRRAWFHATLLWRPRRPPEMDSEWSASAGAGRRQIRLSRRRRLLSAAGREFALRSDGKTLVVLIDDRGNEADAPDVSELAIDIPVSERPKLDFTLPKQQVTAMMTARHKQERSERNAALHAHPAIAAFLSREPSAGQPGRPE